MASFDALLNNLHGLGTKTQTLDNDGAIEITPQRQFNVPKEYNTVLAYAGDVNSQIVTFLFPLRHENHELMQCTNKKLKWRNISSGTEGTSDLKASRMTEDEQHWEAEWEVPPEIMTQAGTLEIAISLYDIVNNKIGFSWNTSVYKGFSIGETFTEVGTYWDEEKLPAANEILIINVDTRMIVMPKGYNTVIANYGDIGISKIFFEIPRYVRGLDVSKEATEIYAVIAFNKETSAEFEIGIEARKPMFNNDGKYLLCWEIPESVTCNKEYYIGTIQLSIKLQNKIFDNNIPKINQRWITSTFTKLSIGPSLVTQDISEFAAREEEVVVRIIDQYFDNNSFVVDAENFN